MYQYEEIRMIHLEITNKCNAACPQCPRNEQGGKINPLLKLTELKIEDIRRILPADFVRQLKTIQLCGNFGDPSNAQDILEVLNYFRKMNKKVHINIYTNGGVRHPEWWAELGSLITKGHGYVRFGIDGLEDTNHMYRRNVRWSAVMENVKYFIEAGGNAEWDFLVFRHNEHQVEEAKILASKMGFSQFFVKKTGRFMEYSSLTPLSKTPVRHKTGRIEYFLMRPANPEWCNDTLKGLTDTVSKNSGIYSFLVKKTTDFVSKQSENYYYLIKKLSGIISKKTGIYDYLVKKFTDAVSKHSGISSYLDDTIITCKVVTEKSIYISADGHVLPCCWLAFHIHGQLPESRDFIRILENIGGIESLNVKHRTIRDIVNDTIFQSNIPESWCKDSISTGRLKTCALMCGNELNYLNIEHQKKSLFNLVAV